MILFALLIVLSVIVVAVTLKSRPKKVRPDYVMPADHQGGEDTEIKGKMPPAQN